MKIEQLRREGSEALEKHEARTRREARRAYAVKIPEVEGDGIDVLGRVHSIAYTGTLSGDGPHLYEHTFEPEAAPILAADSANGQLFIIGGRYTTSSRGIIDGNPPGYPEGFEGEQIGAARMNPRHPNPIPPGLVSRRVEAGRYEVTASDGQKYWVERIHNGEQWVWVTSFAPGTAPPDPMGRMEDASGWREMDNTKAEALEGIAIITEQNRQRRNPLSHGSARHRAMRNSRPPRARLLPIGPANRKWHGEKARKRVRRWATKDGRVDWDKYALAFMYRDPQHPDVGYGFKLPYADVIGGRLMAIPRAIEAIHAVLDGARGGVRIPEAAKDRAKKLVVSYYRKMKTPFTGWS